MLQVFLMLLEWGKSHAFCGGEITTKSVEYKTLKMKVILVKSLVHPQHSGS